MKDLPLKFKNKYRIASDRLQGWDYGTPGYYFVAICTQNQVRWFGEVTGNQIILSAVGEIAQQELEKTPQIRTNVSLEAWVVMPNHIHAILVILEGSGERAETSCTSVETPRTSVETPQRGVSTIKNWRPGTLGAIINQYKSMCTKRIRSMGCVDFAWQRRYYDHIIQDEKSLENIRTYILENPAKWSEDDYFSNL